MSKYKVGDTYKMGYICDCNVHNYEIGTIIWLHDYKYYPTSEKDVFVIKQQAKIKFANNDVILANI